jgi:hypothetical protein
MNTKTFLSSVTALALTLTSASAAFDLGTPASGTPYEAYSGPVKSVLNRLPGQKADMNSVKANLKTGYSFRYSFTTPYLAQSPETTAKTKSGDCKAKSLWLINQLGDRNVRYVIGKARANSKINHAWVMWNDGGKWWILDPTNVSRPIAADSVSKNEFIPLYSYSAGGAYRHAAANASKAAVAGR